MNKARQLYGDDEEESLAVKNENNLNFEKIFTSPTERTKFNMEFHQLSIDEQLKKFSDVLKFTLANKDCSQYNVLKQFITTNFKIFKGKFEKNNYEYRILQEYLQILDLMLNYKSAEFNEKIIDDEIQVIHKQMNEFLALQNQSKKTKKNQKIRQRLRRQRERLEKEVKENKDTVPDVEFIELD